MKYKLITFDVYSALFDIETSLVPLLTPAVGGMVDAVALFRVWRAKQLEQTWISNSLGGARVPFITATRRALDYALGRAKVDLTEAARARLATAWDQLQPWGEARAVVEAVHARGYPIALLSNGDEVMLRALAEHNHLRFDHIFASDQAGYYKPHPSIYQLPLKALGLAGAEVLHVAGGATDTLGTKGFVQK